MESIKISFLEPFADGLRRLTMVSWSGVCLIVARSRLASALNTEELAHAGVYILVGPSRVVPKNGIPTLSSELYIGKSESLDERIALHNKYKVFWTTAFVFFRDGDPLDAGQSAALEAQLIAKAKASGNDVIELIHNIANPPLNKAMDDADGIHIFLRNIETMLATLGYDFFSSQKIPDVATLGPLEAATAPAVDVPEDLQSVVDQIRLACLALPSTAFYATHVPDLRAKVVSGNDFRVFARIQFRKHALKLTLNQNQVFNLTAGSMLDQDMKDNIKTAYVQVRQRLEN